MSALNVGEDMNASEEYEVKVLMLISLRSALNMNIVDLKLRSFVSDVAPFGDIVLDVSDDTRIIIVVKYNAITQAINDASFQGRKRIHNMNLHCYFEKFYKSIHKCQDDNRNLKIILFTNRPVDVNENGEYANGLLNIVHDEQLDLINFLSVSTGEIYKLNDQHEFVEDNFLGPEKCHFFLNNTYIFANQGVDVMKQDIIESINMELPGICLPECEKVYETFLNYCKNYSSINDPALIPLDKHVITNLIFFSYLHRRREKLNGRRNSFDKGSLFNEVMENHLTIMDDKTNVDHVKIKIKQILTEFSDNDIDEIMDFYSYVIYKRECKKVKHDCDILYNLLWLLGELPFIIKVNNQYEFDVINNSIIDSTNFNLSVILFHSGTWSMRSNEKSCRSIIVDVQETNESEAEVMKYRTTFIAYLLLKNSRRNIEIELHEKDLITVRIPDIGSYLIKISYRTNVADITEQDLNFNCNFHLEYLINSNKDLLKRNIDKFIIFTNSEMSKLNAHVEQGIKEYSISTSNGSMSIYKIKSSMFDLSIQSVLESTYIYSDQCLVDMEDENEEKLKYFLNYDTVLSSDIVSDLNGFMVPGNKLTKTDIIWSMLRTFLGSRLGKYIENQKNLLTIAIEENFRNIIEIVLDDFNNKDKFGRTALHYAARSGNSTLVLKLLQHGASIGVADKSNDYPIKDIDVDTLEYHLNSCIKTIPSLHNTRQVCFDYQTLLDDQSSCICEYTPSANAEASKFIDKESESMYVDCSIATFMCYSSEHKRLLKHPMISTLINLKWNSFKFLYFANFLLYFTFCVSLLLFTFYKNEFSRFFLLITFLGLIIREFYQVWLLKFQYCTYADNWTEIVLLIFVLCSLLEVPFETSAITILLATYMFIYLIGQYFTITNILMFRVVGQNYIKFCLSYILLIMAYTYGFITLFKSPTDEETNLNFNTFLDSIFKTFIMVTGEFEGENIDFNRFPVISRIFFMSFVFLVAIIFMNMLNGIAISDIQEIKNDAEIIALSARIDYLHSVECSKLHLKTKNLKFFISTYKIGKKIIDLHKWLISKIYSTKDVHKIVVKNLFAFEKQICVDNKIKKRAQSIIVTHQKLVSQQEETETEYTKLILERLEILEKNLIKIRNALNDDLSSYSVGDKDEKFS